MEAAASCSNQENLEQFLEELILQSNRPDEIDSLFEALQSVQKSSAKFATIDDANYDPSDGVEGRFDFFKICPDGILRIGYVRGVENAKKILPNLNSQKDGLYFVYDTSARKIVVFLRDPGG
jgi:hypothetical protein